MTLKNWATGTSSESSSEISSTYVPIGKPLDGEFSSTKSDALSIRAGLQILTTSCLTVLLARQSTYTIGWVISISKLVIELVLLMNLEIWNAWDDLMVY